MGKSYWMIAESLENFQITKSLGFTLYGAGPKHRRRAERMQPDDRMLYYVKGLRKWTATATITSRSFEERTDIWAPNRRRDVFPYRVKTAPDIVLDEEDYIDALMLAPRLEYVKRWPPEDWPLAFFDRLHLLPQRDFRLIEGEMQRNLSMRRKRAALERAREPRLAGPAEDSTRDEQRESEPESRAEDVNSEQPREPEPPPEESELDRALVEE